MKLYELKRIIKDDLDIYVLNPGHLYKNVCVNDVVFQNFVQCEVISIRSRVSAEGIDAPGIVVFITELKEETL